MPIAIECCLDQKHLILFFLFPIECLGGIQHAPRTPDRAVNKLKIKPYEIWQILTNSTIKKILTISHYKHFDCCHY
jgi:hypothetical protein